MDEGSTLYQRRQWASQNPLEEVKGLGTREEQHRTPSRIFSVRHGVKFVQGHPIGSLLSCLIVGMMVLNLNQGPILHANLSSHNKIHNSHDKPLRTLERVISDNGCKKTPFVTPHESTYEMPLTPAWYNGQLPSHVQLCEELINRNNFVTRVAQQDQSGGLRSTPTFDKFVVRESPILCQDWSKPHSALMQLISSSIIAYAGERFGLEYHHGCHKLLEAEYIRGLGFDVTTVQQVFPELKMPIDQRVLSLGDVVFDLCNSCIQEYNNNGAEIGSYDATHHCLGFPDRGPVSMGTVNQQIQGRNGMPEMIMKEELVDSQGNIFHSALESVLPLVRNRLWHQARDWQVEAMIPRNDPLTGSVIFFDSGQSLPIPFHLYKDYIPDDTSRIDIISGPNCASGNLAISMSRLEPLSCLEHLTELREYLHNYGSEFGVEVTFTLVSSTATQFTRMTQTSTLICPPETLSCLLPTLAKERTKNAVIFESPESTTSYWFDSLGNAVQNINVIRLTHDQMAMDREQQFIEAKFQGFSTDQVVGRAPPGLNRPNPLDAILGDTRDTPSEDTRGRSNVDEDSSSAQEPAFINDYVPQEDTSYSFGEDENNGQAESTISYDEGSRSEPQPEYSFDNIINDESKTTKKHKPVEVHIRTDLNNGGETDTGAAESSVMIGNLIQTGSQESERESERGYSNKELHVIKHPKTPSGEYELITEEDQTPSESKPVYNLDAIFHGGEDDDSSMQASYRKHNDEKEEKQLWGSTEGESNSGMSLHGGGNARFDENEGSEAEVSYKSMGGPSVGSSRSDENEGIEAQGSEAEVSYKSMGAPSGASEEEEDVDIDYKNLFGNWR